MSVRSLRHALDQGALQWHTAGSTLWTHRCTRRRLSADLTRRRLSADPTRLLLRARAPPLSARVRYGAKCSFAALFIVGARLCSHYFSIVRQPCIAQHDLNPRGVNRARSTVNSRRPLAARTSDTTQIDDVTHLEASRKAREGSSGVLNPSTHPREPLTPNKAANLPVAHSTLQLSSGCRSPAPLEVGPLANSPTGRFGHHCVAADAVLMSCAGAKSASFEVV